MIKLKNNLIEYYRNPAGYVKNNVATIDNKFNCDELDKWLEKMEFKANYQDNIFEKLIMNRKFFETEDAEPLRKIRVWQLRQGFDVECRFISFDEMYAQHGEPIIDDYETVFDGDLPTNDLEKIYEICNTNHPEKYTGHSLSMSDVVELYDDAKSEFFYVDRFGFKKIDFKHQQSETMEITMQIVFIFQINN